MSECRNERARARRAKWIACGLCSVCGSRAAVSGRRLCRVCADNGNAVIKKRYAARAAQGLCPICGKTEPAPGRKLCKACGVKRGGASCSARNRENQKRLYWARVADGLCVTCGTAAPEPDRRFCPACADKDRARARVKRRRLRAAGLCVDCQKPSSGTYLCAPCQAKMRHYAARAMPVWSPSYTVWEIATDRCHGTWDSQEDVSLCLAFAKLGRDEVEIVTDAPAIAGFVGWA